MIYGETNKAAKDVEWSNVFFRYYICNALWFKIFIFHRLSKDRFFFTTED